MILVLTITLLLATTGVNSQTGTLDQSVCNLPTAVQGGPPVPQFGNLDHFEAYIECNMKDIGETIEVKEYYDKKEDRGTLDTVQYGQGIYLIYDYSVLQIYEIVQRTSTENPVCQTRPMQSSAQNGVFGLNTGTDNSGHIFSVAQMFNLGTNGMIYAGTTTVRGMPVHRYSLCVYWDQWQSSIQTDYYFTASDYPNPYNWASMVPVRITAKGLAQGPPHHRPGDPVNPNEATMTQHNFDHVYDIFFFKPYVNDRTVFDIPAGVFCPGRPPVKAIPDIPAAFSYRSEILVKYNFVVSYIDEYYDYNSKLVRYDYKPLAASSTSFGTDNEIVVHDFNTGVEYLTDAISGNCTVRPITNTSFDSEAVDPYTIRMRDKFEFFEFDKVNYTYSGVKELRGIPCDVWITTRMDWPFKGKVTSWEWWFSATFPYYTIYNTYAFDNSQPKFEFFDINHCFPAENRKRLQVQFPAAYFSQVFSNQTLFKEEMLLALVQTGQVSPLRVIDIKLDYDDSRRILVQFTLLDKAPIAGSVYCSGGCRAETPLQEAINKVKSAVNSNQFTVQMPNPKDPTRPLALTAYPDKYRDDLTVPGAPQQGYSSGDMAGLAMGMIILGLLIGGGSGFFVFRNA
ncbi:Hypp9244 [Branchiostoma lanceolatum]|uniref:Hypp9244 protein n=1 Tax=Branchiostoma lanceolatum TaxID=7740 RepID=A0A8J9ZCX6_BRALA|nr:Hypp9244 [Branchiostoma lanceolatum]